jgi:hypothetical protein
MKTFITIFLSTLLYGQVIQHEIPKSIPANYPYQVHVFVDLNPSEIYSFKLMYRFSNQEKYYETNMTSTGIGNYFVEVPGNLITLGEIEYFFVLELAENLGFISFPQSEPMQHPVTVPIDMDLNIIEKVKSDNLNLQSRVTIMSPQPNSKIMKEDLLVAVSYFQSNDIDLESIILLLDNKDVTSQATIRKSHLVFNPDKIYPGEHSIRLKMKNSIGIDFSPVEWEFTLITREEHKENEKSFTYSGRAWSDYSQNTVDSLQIEYNTINYDIRGNMDWLKFRSKVMISSLENEFEQSRNRYLLDFDTPFLKFNIGDVYPSLGQYTLKGYRVRGLDFKFSTKLFQLNYVQGQLARATQGNPLDNAIIISDVLDSTITLSRYNYAFDQNIYAVNIGIGNPSKFHWNINAMKAKDDVTSVNRDVEGANIVMTDDIQELYSQVFVDLDGDEKFGNPDTISTVYTKSSNWIINDENLLAPPVHSELLDTYFIETIAFGSLCEDEDCEVEHDLLQYKWIISLNNLNYNGDSIQIGDASLTTYTIESLSDNEWEGKKPEDNIVFGSDLSMSFDNQKIKLKTGFAFSMLNQNIWTPVMTIAELDTLMDEDLDSLMAGTEIPFDPAAFEDIFYMNINQIPLIPIDITSEKIGLGEVLMMPSLAYNIDLSLNYLGHKLDFGFKQVGPEFNSLSNPYIQKDIREQSFSDRMRFLENRMFVLFKWKRTEDGILEEEIGKTDRFDLNLSLYPGIDLPTFNIGFGSYIRDNGISESECYDADGIFFTCSDTLDFNSDYFEYLDYTLVSRKESTKSNQFNISVSNRFNFYGKQHINFNLFSSEKTDLMAEENQGNGDYYSPRSQSNATSINLKSIFSNHWESTTYFSHSYYDYGESTDTHPEYFQKQTIDSFDLTTYYIPTNFLKQLYSGFNYSVGSGTANYNQFGFKLGVKLEPIQKLVVRVNYNIKYKSVEEESDTYKNSSLTAKIQYQF